MPKRFTDTDKWKKPFIRSLEGPYKLLWFYILDDCDHAGIWHVDFEVAKIRVGVDVSKEKAEHIFGDRIEIFDDGTKWFIIDFVTFQYGCLNEKNRLHLSVINILQKHKVGPYKVLVRSQGQEQGKGNGQGYDTDPDFFESNAQAYMLLSGNYHDTDAATKIIANNGWPAVNENEVKALIHHFIETQADVKKQDRSDIRQHLRRWLNKQSVDKMREWAKNILENHARRGQRQV